MFVWRRRDGRASLKISEMESPNEGLTTIFHSLQLVERPIFITDILDFWPCLVARELLNFIPIGGNTFLRVPETK